MKMIFWVQDVFAGHVGEGGMQEETLLIYAIIFFLLYALLTLILMGIILWSLLRLHRKLGEFFRVRS